MHGRPELQLRGRQGTHETPVIHDRCLWARWAAEQAKTGHPTQGQDQSSNRAARSALQGLRP
eukprot:15151293-Alexandrium_andersonii.AAC.1